jgi:aspartokinase/homoserine dehydrogenase 1
LKNLLVMKFGGTSVGSAERMRAAAALTANQNRKRPVAIVVSAMSKITDLLLDTMRHAEAGDHAGINSNLAALRTRHEDACRGLLPETRHSTVMAGIHGLIGEFERIVNGMAMLNERPPRSVDEAVAVGETVSKVSMAKHK